MANHTKGAAFTNGFENTIDDFRIALHSPLGSDSSRVENTISSSLQESDLLRKAYSAGRARQSSARRFVACGSAHRTDAPYRLPFAPSQRTFIPLLSEWFFRVPR